MNGFRFFLLLGFFFILSSCNHFDQKSTIKKYLFLAHTYQWGVVDNNRIDYRLKNFNFEKYDQIWLGGDLCARTSEQESTLDYLDSIFDLSSPNTLWALGNHDLVEGHVSYITEKTKRNTFLSKFENGIGIVVLNTTQFYHPNYHPKPEECALLDGQLEVLENIADTIKEASHLLILHHDALGIDQINNDSVNARNIFNAAHPNYLVSCKKADRFEMVIYPLLKKIQEKGTQVITVAGDLGQKSKEFEFVTKEGIYILGSGINNSAISHHLPKYVTNTDPDKLLIFNHNVTKKELSWEYVELTKLIESNKKSSEE